MKKIKNCDYYPSILLKEIEVFKKGIGILQDRKTIGNGTKKEIRFCRRMIKYLETALEAYIMHEKEFLKELKDDKEQKQPPFAVSDIELNDNSIKEIAEELLSDVSFIDCRMNEKQIVKDEQEEVKIEHQGNLVVVTAKNMVLVLNQYIYDQILTKKMNKEMKIKEKLKETQEKHNEANVNVSEYIKNVLSESFDCIVDYIDSKVEARNLEWQCKSCKSKNLFTTLVCDCGKNYINKSGTRYIQYRV